MPLTNSGRKNHGSRESSGRWLPARPIHSCLGDLRVIFAPIVLVLYLLVTISSAAVEEAPQRIGWTASWIAHPTAPLREPGVFHFRKIFELPNRPVRFIVHVSADNRFLLFVNGRRVGEGPARGDLRHWRYETFDLAPFLVAGRNVVAATVWQFGIYAPLAQISNRTAFLMEGDSESEAAVNTGSTWDVELEEGHSPARAIPEGMFEYYAAGPGEHIDGTRYDWDWMKESSAGGDWVKAGPAIRESIYAEGSVPVAESQGGDSNWWLVPDSLPPMEFTEIPSGRVVRSSLPSAPSFPSAPAVIPPNTDAALLIDAGVVLSAYPQLIVDHGRGARVQLVYTEALFDSRQQRSNRSEVGDRVALGVTDEFIPDGAEARSFMPLWWRTWRYVELRIHTGSDPLTLVGFHTFYTAYPFVEKGEFASSDPELARIGTICWRTARLDAHETYMDTAYWEQLQYIGDTRIQALISYVVSGDDRLARQALRAFDASRVPDGITQSRYPTSLVQLIPPFSLIYVDMLHDYWMYRTDAQFVKELLPGTRSVLAWFQRRQRADGFLGPLPYWEFVDTPRGREKFPPVDEQGRSAILTLQFIAALEDAAAMEESLGDPSIAAGYREQARSAATAVFRLCWNPHLGLLADTPDQKEYSQHANVLAVLTDVIPHKDQPAVMRQILSKTAPELAMASYFFQFYITRAIDHAGIGDLYLGTLAPWRQMLAQGLTTTPEYPDPSRSDTHAWSAHPAFDLVTMIAGIRPASPGFTGVRIQPGLADLAWVEASMPHPAGPIRTSFHRVGNSVSAVVELPDGIRGTLQWKGTQYDLHPGKQEFTLP
jgi:alpha-L-rhamnosidase